MIYVNFAAGISTKTTETFMKCLADQTNRGEKGIYILFSSPGGSVRDGVALHNYIKSLPARVIMHNIGIIDSVANIVFLAGTERYAVPHSSFLFHGVGFNISQPTRFEEKELNEKIKVIERDQKILLGIITEETKLNPKEIRRMFLEAQTKTPEEARKVGIIHEIKDVKIPDGAKIVSLVFK